MESLYTNLLMKNENSIQLNKNN